MTRPESRNQDIPIVRNSFFVFISRGVDFLSGFLTMIIAARYLGVTLFGDFMFIRAVEIILAQAISFGSHRIIVREISVNRQNTSVMSCCGLVVNTVMGAAATLLALGIGWAYGLSALSQGCLAAAMISQVFWKYTDTLRAAFIAHEKMNLLLVVNTIVKVLILVFFMAVWLLDMGIAGLFAGLVAANAIGLAAGAHCYRSRIPKTPWRLERNRLVYLIRQSLPMATSQFFVMTYNQAGVFFLKSWHNSAQVSFFQMPQRLLLIIALYPASIILSIVPLVSRLAANPDTRAELKTFIELIWKYLLIATLPVCVLTLSPLLELGIRILIGPDFLPAADSCRILVWTVPMIMSNVLLAEILVSMKKQHLMLASEGVCLLATLGFGLFLVPRFGHAGASFALLVANTMLFVCQYVFVWVHFFRLTMGVTLIRLAACAGVMAAIISWPRPSLLVAAAAGCAVYALSSVTFGLIRPAEFRRLVTIVRSDAANRRAGRKAAGNDQRGTALC